MKRTKFKATINLETEIKHTPKEIEQLLVSLLKNFFVKCKIIIK